MPKAHPDLVDHTDNVSANSTTVERVYKVVEPTSVAGYEIPPGHTIKVTIRRDAYAHQSFATAKALSVTANGDSHTLAWVDMVNSGPSNWWSGVRTVEHMNMLADELYTRALLVLGA